MLPGYCFKDENHACEADPVGAGLEVSIESFTTWGSASAGYARTALVETGVRNAVTETVNWLNVQASAAGAAVAFSYSQFDEVSESEFAVARDERYQVGMLTPEQSQFLDQDDVAVTTCWGDEAGQTAGCDVAFRSVRNDPELKRWVAGGALPADPLRFHRYLGWATDLPRDADDPSGGQLSLRYVLAHELGHVLGFGESPDVEDSLMGTPFGVGTSLPLDLSCDDRRALLFLYCPETLGESSCTDDIVARAMDCYTSG